MRVLGQQTSHLLLIRTNLGYGTVLTATCARPGCSASGLVFCFFFRNKLLLGRSNQGECGRRGMRHTWEKGETCIGFWWQSPRERDHLEEQGADWRMGSKLTLGEVGSGGVEWIHLARDRDRWRAVVNAVMNPRVLAPRS
jgi:hypothetical protein